MPGVTTASGHRIDAFGQLHLDAASRALGRVGVVDVGSNSVRLVVFDGAARSPAYYYNEKVLAGLGAGLAATGRLNPQGRARAMAALKRFAALAEGMGIAPPTCVGTSAMREAEDGAEFCAEVEAQTGLRLLVVDGQEEARLSAQGVLLGWPTARGLVCDIGGNSLELAEIVDGRIGRRASSLLGPFRLQQVAPERIDGLIRRTVEALKTQLGGTHPVIYLVGGSWRAIARLDMQRRDYPMTVLHEYHMDRSAVATTVAAMQDAPALERLRAGTGISSLRLDLVPLASRVLAQLAESFAPEAFFVSAYGIREGLLYEQMPEALRARDPLIEAARWAEQHDARLPGFGKRLYQFLHPLFDDAPPARDRLIRAACLMHDITWRTHPDYRADACFDTITRANLSALTHPERVFLGVALLHRYKSKRSDSGFAPLFGLLSESELRDAEVLGRAMRFGAMFSIRDPNDAGRLSYDRAAGRLRLELAEIGRDLFGEVAEARLRALAQALGAQVEIA